ncbi:Phosphatidylinositol N-acetyglucosaminlytransferase subunit P-related [Quillaja saponaria]|uniref:Phosphatidylinositol N-acetyglucosaminlytransferase subunit P-related n=1 Tax=Quillaja saponaria TaxID=32244 RepID=A0AAD7Q0R1_QUISA|nr:Phosphatidylinositol N-acetyglucosaminlytransferase subunit P-related [Quillaja saponaria]
MSSSHYILQLLPLTRVPNRRVHAIEKPYPGCLGRMVNRFDLTTGVTENRMLTDEPHIDVFSLLRSRSDAAGMTNIPVGNHIEKLIVSDLRRTGSKKKVNGTSMKILIDQEMSKEVNSMQNPPNVVAKLMGLDSFPSQQPDSAVQRSHTDYSQLSHSDSGIPLGCWKQVDGFTGRGMPREFDLCSEQKNYNNIQFQRTSVVGDKSAQRGSYNEDIDKELAFFCQKFADLKRMGTDNKQRQSKKFRDTLEYVSSRDDLLFKYLQDNDSFSSQRLFEVRSMPPSETKHITVLRPSKMACNDILAASGKRSSENDIRKSANFGQAAVLDKNNLGQSPITRKNDEDPVQPTRIVVLKPSPGKTRDIKAVVSPTSSSPRVMQRENFNEEIEDDEVLESRKVAKEIAEQMRGNLIGHWRDETFYSSVFSNGYIGNESSFNKSENGYGVGNFSDLEVMSPSPKHSWDYINRCGSPFSSSSFSRASCSPESSVCREAKKRLSERWAMMASNGSSQEQRHMRRSSSTLGDMLALSDIKRSARSEDKDGNKDQEPRESVSCSTSNLNEDLGVCGSPKNLQRSKSVPVSFAGYETRLNVEVCNPEAGKAHASKEKKKAKSMKSSSKGKVTSLFFSRNKKSSKEKSSACQSTVGTPEFLAHSPGNLRDEASESFNDGGPEEILGSLGKCSPELIFKPRLSVFSPTMSGIGRENQDQPSPISVLNPPFEEDDNAAQESSANIKACHQGTEVLRCNLIDKSPPIESIARTLSRDDTCAEVLRPYSLKSSMVSPDSEEEQDWLVLVQTLLSAAGLDDQVQSDSLLFRWHSLESPLDPSLRDKYANLNVKEPLQEAKRRQQRSIRKLVFDSVNAALIEITGYGSEKYPWGRTCSGGHCRLSGSASPILVECVMAQMKELLSGEMRCFWGDCRDSNSVVVEKVVRKEVVGKGWAELMRLEINKFAKEIELKLLEELVVEAVVDLKDRV